MSIDDELRDIIATENRHSDETARYDMEGLIARIKKCFADKFLRPEDLGLLTGQEWYDRFGEELGKDVLEMTRFYSLPVNIILRDAKRAAGLE